MRKCVICLEQRCDTTKGAMSTDTLLALVFEERRRSAIENRKKEHLSTEQAVSGLYRAVGSRPECQKSHLLCDACTLEFALNPTNTVCPICRAPLEHAVQLCHDWLIERERAEYMQNQTSIVRDLTDLFVDRMRSVYVEDIERATESALDRVLYKLRPETSRGFYRIDVQMLGANNDSIEWQYRSNSGRVERHCQIPVDRSGRCLSENESVSVTLNSHDWRHLCRDLFGIDVEPIASSLSQMRKRKRCCSGSTKTTIDDRRDLRASVEPTAVHYDAECPTPMSPLNRAENHIYYAQERFNSACEAFEEDVRYNTRAPRREEMIMLMRRFRATGYRDDDTHND